ncbi:unnamed protein product [Trichogramma brassicae]|uniref:Uncharacterized protein n=1 Tax=Trichogramma brassicae TaxID=86971 RepID=A0A6H5IWR4_9HYME|nr:unnamed protein product [Trichogramma brassicae]
MDYVRWVLRLDFCTPGYIIVRETGKRKMHNDWIRRAVIFERKYQCSHRLQWQKESAKFIFVLLLPRAVERLVRERAGSYTSCRGQKARSRERPSRAMPFYLEKRRQSRDTGIIRGRYNTSQQLQTETRRDQRDPLQSVQDEGPWRTIQISWYGD